MSSPSATVEAPAVRVWWAAVRPPTALDLSALSAAERTRVDRLVSTPAAGRAATARVLLRAILAATFGEAPSAFAIDWQRGPQLITRRGAAPWLSLSHTGERVVVAVSTAGPVGIDIEPRLRAGRLTDGLIASIAAPSEQRALSALGGEERRSAALSLWTAKEAVLKATGEGLETPPADVEVDGLSGDEQLRLVAHAADSGLAGRCWLVRLAADPAYVGALAVVTGGGPAPPVHELAGDALLAGAD